MKKNENINKEKETIKEPNRTSEAEDFNIKKFTRWAQQLPCSSRRISEPEERPFEIVKSEEWKGEKKKKNEESLRT